MSRKKKKNNSWMIHILIVCMIIGSVLFSSITIILIVGMIPTLVAAIVDRSPGYLKSLSIGIMNLSGCSPFLYDVIYYKKNMDMALNVILEPQTVVIVYFAAAMGYMVNWSVTGIVSSIMVQKAKLRLDEIAVIKAGMVERWGEEVTGNVPLDESGFSRAEKDEAFS